MNYTQQAKLIADLYPGTHAVFLALGGSAGQRYAGYRELFDEHLGSFVVDRIRESANGGFVLGNERFQREVAAMLGRRTWKGSPGRAIALKIHYKSIG